jgi:outer membrane protein assembly factor BamB
MRRTVSVVALWCLGAGSARAENWPQWRGPRGNGVSAERGLPHSWSDDENVGWKSTLGGLSVSTPVVWGDRVFVTSQKGRGVLREGRNHPTLGRGGELPEELSLGDIVGGVEDSEVVFLVEAFASEDGRRLWSHETRADAPGQMPEVHRKHNLASPSPVTDGETVYAWFGTGQLVALDLDGSLRWQKHLGREYGPFDIPWGHSSSPTLYQDLVLLLCDHTPSSYLLALDKRTGEERWKADRGEGLRSYSTPTVVPGPDGDELLVNSSERLEGYDPKTGARKWFFVESNQFPIPVPSFHDGVIYTTRGYRSGPYMAIRPGGRGDIAGTDHMIWHVPTGAPYVSSLVQYEGVVYMASDSGVLQAADARTGERLWQERTGGVFSAAPVAGDGKIYFLSETGETVVLAAGRTPEVLARNALSARFLASPVVSGGRLYLRSDGEVLSIGGSASSTSSP